MKNVRSQKTMLFQKVYFNNNVSEYTFPTTDHKSDIFVSVLVKTSKRQTKELTK